MKFIYKQDKTEELYHHGVEGQKWGVKHGPPYPLDRATHNRIVRGKPEKSSKPSSSFVERTRNKIKLDKELYNRSFGNTNFENNKYRNEYLNTFDEIENKNAEVLSGLSKFYKSQIGNESLYKEMLKTYNDKYLYHDDELADFVYEKRPKEIKNKQKELDKLVKKSDDLRKDFIKEVDDVFNEYKDMPLPKFLNDSNLKDYLYKQLGIGTYAIYVKNHYESNYEDIPTLWKLIDDYTEWRINNNAKTWDEDFWPED